MANTEKHDTRSTQKENAIILTEPTAEYAQQISEYRREFLESGDSMDGTDDLRTIANPIAWIHHCEDCKEPEKVPEGLEAATQYIYVREEGRIEHEEL